MFWFNGNVAEAIEKSKREKKVFIVFINGNDVLSQKMNQMYEKLSSELSGMALVAIKLEANSDYCKLFSAIYPVLVIPCTYFIDINGVAIEIIGGSVENESDLMEKIKKIIDISNKSISASDSQNSTQIEKTDKTNSPSSSSQTSAETPVNSLTKTEAKPESSASCDSSSASLESKVERANQLLEAIREKKIKEEEEKAKKEEIERRQGLKEMQKSKRLREEKEAQEAIYEREKAKREEKIARERILAQIAADREERKARQMVLNSAESSESKPIESTAGSSSSSVRERLHERARIQFRLPDGSTRNHEFGANDSLDIVRQYLYSNLSLRDFVLSTTFPRREFIANDYNQTLQQLSLSPSSVLLVIPNKGINNSRAVTSPSFIWQLITLVFSPFVIIWNFISRFFSSSDSSDSNDDLTASLGRIAKKKPKAFYSREGNVARIRDPMKDDDDDNSTWNGNSTQQM